jgi:hypothetical protein
MPLRQWLKKYSGKVMLEDPIKLKFSRVVALINEGIESKLSARLIVNVALLLLQIITQIRLNPPA